MCFFFLYVKLQTDYYASPYECTGFEFTCNLGYTVDMYDYNITLFEAECLAGDPFYCGFCLKPGYCPEVQNSTVENCNEQKTCLSPLGDLYFVDQVLILTAFLEN